MSDEHDVEECPHGCFLFVDGETITGESIVLPPFKFTETWVVGHEVKQTQLGEHGQAQDGD